MKIYSGGYTPIDSIVKMKLSCTFPSSTPSMFTHCLQVVQSLLFEVTTALFFFIANTDTGQHSTRVWLFF